VIESFREAFSPSAVCFPVTHSCDERPLVSPLFSPEFDQSRPASPRHPPASSCSLSNAFPLLESPEIPTLSVHEGSFQSCHPRDLAPVPRCDLVHAPHFPPLVLPYIAEMIVVFGSLAPLPHVAPNGSFLMPLSWFCLSAFPRTSPGDRRHFAVRLVPSPFLWHVSAVYELA